MKMADQNIIDIENESDIQIAAESDPQMLPPMPELAQTPQEPDLIRLYSAATYGNWETAKAIINKDENAKTRKISSLGFTALHVAASCGRSMFVVELVKHLTKEELEIRDQVGCTALHHAATAASVRAAKAMVEKSPRLPQLGDMDLQTPLLYAAQSKRKEMLKYLHTVTKDEPPCHAFTGNSASNLVVAITASGSHGIALSILKTHPELAQRKNDKGMSILHVLAMQPSAFWTRFGISIQYLSTYQWMRRVFERKRRHSHAFRVVDLVCKQLQKESISVIQDFFVPEDNAAILHLATEHGTFSLIKICLEYFPDLIWYADNKRQLLLHVAIQHRRALTFNYITRLIGVNTKAYAELVDEGLNNSLHLAGKLAPSSQLQSVLGPIFHMQREIQWFKAVEALVDYESTKMKNQKEQTPRELFMQDHEKLVNAAKDWMKDLSNSCMIVTVLVATVAFAAMITVPGGTDSNTGIPILSKKKLFIAFIISNAFSMISSTISLLMFLLVQTSIYSEEDFLDSIPRVLRYGLFFLVIAVGTMMISFGTAIGLSLQKRIEWAYIPITVVACCPAIIFYGMQLPLISALFLAPKPGIFQR